MDLNLHVYQQLLLLLLKDKEGTVFSGIFYQQALAGAMIADLLLSRHIDITKIRRSRLINLINSNQTGDDLLDECISKIKNAKRPATIQTWISRFSSLKSLKNRAAISLVRKGILHMDEDKVLFIFRRKIYPETDHEPEREIIGNLQQAIFSDEDKLDPRTLVLLALCHSASVLRYLFDKNDLKSRKKRIEKIAAGEVTGLATKEVIQAVQTAIMIAAIMPAIIASTTTATS